MSLNESFGAPDGRCNCLSRINQFPSNWSKIGVFCPILSIYYCLLPLILSLSQIIKDFLRSLFIHFYYIIAIHLDEISSAVLSNKYDSETYHVVKNI